MGIPLSERIVVDPEVLAGKPVIRGTRLAVEFILELLAAGQSESDLLSNRPGLLVVPQLLGPRVQGISDSSVDATPR